MAYDPTTQVTNDVHDNLASYHNELKTAIDHLMSSAAYASYVRAQSMTGNVTLTDSDFPIQSFSPTAARDLTLPAVAGTNHAFYVINRSSSYDITVKNSGGTAIGIVAPGMVGVYLSDGANGYYELRGTIGMQEFIERASDPATPATNKWNVYFKAGGLYIKDDAGVVIGPVGSGLYGGFFDAAGTMLNGKISVTVASNNITVAIKTLAGNDPSVSDPVYVRIKDTVRSITAALSVTKNAGTNWFNAGSAELATKEIDYFVYLIWNTTPATDIVDLGFARIPHGRVYSDFSGTTTNEKYMAFANASTPTSTDDVVNIGRFAATLSAGAGYTWSVPSFTSVNLVQRPIYETRWLNYVPQWSASGSMTISGVTVSHAKYRIFTDNCEVDITISAFTIGGTASSILYSTLPLSALLTDYPMLGFALLADAGGLYSGYFRIDGATVARDRFQKTDGSNIALGAGTYFQTKGAYAI